MPFLLVEENTLIGELDAQRVFIQLFIKTVAKLTMNLHRRANDALRKFNMESVFIHNLRNLRNLWLNSWSASADSATLVEGFALDFDAVDDGDDGGVHGDEFEALGGTGGAALAEHDKLAFPGTDGINSDDGVSSVFEFRRILVIDQLGTEQQEFSSHHELVLLGRDNLSNDFGEEHGRMS
jgi:hypothetical protein